MKKFPGLIALPFLLIMAGCRIQVFVPEGGTVETRSGAFSCGSGETCVIEVNDTFFNEEFIARPDQGKVFTHWKRKDFGFCPDKTSSCLLATTSFEGNDSLLAILESDRKFYLEPIFREPDSYLAKSDMLIGGPTRSTCSVRGKVYVFGAGWETGEPLDTTQEYDPSTDTWSLRASMPSPRAWATAAALNGKCYVIGGSAGTDSSTSVYIYDPKSDSWGMAAPLPESRYSASSVAFLGKIYVFGGSTGALSGFAVSNPDVFVYDPEVNAWTRGADMPSPRRRMVVGVVGDRIFTIGGEHLRRVATVVESYNPVAGSWSRHAPLPVGLAAAAAGVIGDKIYVFGGFNPDPLSRAFRYDPAVNSWREISNTTEARGDISAERVGGQIFIIGGRAPDHEGIGFRLTESYAPSSN